MEILILGALLGLIPGAIGHGKGQSFAGWWLFGALLFIVALPCAILAKPDTAALEARARQSGMKKCPYCAELVKAEAVACRYCQRDLATAAQ